MILPLALIILALCAAAAVAYGTQPGWAEFQHGLQLILWSRRLQWPLVAVALLLCVALIGLVISGRRRAWWLIGLMPILALFLHRFHNERARAFDVTENPTFADAADATFVADGDWVAGLTLGDTAYAYPYAALFRSPVVLQSEHERRIILVWSPYANRLLAFTAGPELKARDLEVVSMPANATLLYNARLGQFVNGLKGQTLDGQKPGGFGTPVMTEKMTWKQWRAAHPRGKVMRPTRPGGPTQPVLPAYAAPGLPAAGKGPRVRVAVVGTTRPVVVESDTIDAAPLNLRADDGPVMMFRPTPGQPARAFSRVFADDVRSQFDPIRDPKHPDVRFRDVDTGAHWNADGVAVAGNRSSHGKRLKPLPADEDVDWAVLKYWYPELALHQPEAKPPAAAPANPTTRPAKPTARNGASRRTPKPSTR